MSKGEFVNDECGTVGCAGTGWGISIMVSRPSVYRCAECVQCLDALAPNWVDGLTDRDAYEERNRALGAMDAATLREQAAPVLARITAARRAYHGLADVAGATFARQAVTDIVNAADKIIDVTVTNWWAAHRWPQHHPNQAPDSAPYTFTRAWPVRVHGTGIGTVGLVLDGLRERYQARDICGGPLRPDLLPDSQPLFDSPAEAAAALAERAWDMGWVDSCADDGSDT